MKNTPPKPEQAFQEMPRGIYNLLMLAFALILGACYFTMVRQADTAMMIVICAVYTSMYFGVPWLLLRVQKQHQVHDNTNQHVSMRSFEDNGLETFTGHMTATEVKAQILLIPFLLALALFAMGIIIILIR